MAKQASKSKARRPKLKIFLFVLLVLAIIEAVALLWMLFTVKHYANYWRDKAKQPGEITYLALGDSAAQGIGASSPMRGYVGLIAKRLEKKTGKSVQVINLSVTGATLKDALRDQIPAIADIKADYVTIEIGANDVKLMQPEEFRKNFVVLLGKLPAGTYVSNMPLFNSRRSQTKPAKKLSRIVEAELKNFPTLRFVDLQKQTAEHQSIFGFAPDTFHPNNLSYKNWAQAFWNEIDK
jgi:lysophospholipase L1-like esterase